MEISDIVATTVKARSGVLADNLSNSNALLHQLRKRGNVRQFAGGNIITEELMFNDPGSKNAGAYSGYDTISFSPNSPITAAQFSIKQYAAAITISGMEQLQNTGKERVIDLLEGRIKVAEAQLMNAIGSDIYSDGSDIKRITGLAAAVSATPNQGNYGGINRQQAQFWRNKYIPIAVMAAADGPINTAAVQGHMNNMATQLVRGADRPDMIIAGANMYKAFLESLQSIQRVTSSDNASAGFPSIKYLGAGLNCDVFLEGEADDGGINTDHMYFLNTKYIFLRPHRDRNFVPIGGDRQSVNQDALVRLIGWAGNLTCSGAKFNGLLRQLRQ